MKNCRIRPFLGVPLVSTLLACVLAASAPGLGGCFVRRDAPTYVGAPTTQYNRGSNPDV